METTLCNPINITTTTTTITASSSTTTATTTTSPISTINATTNSNGNNSNRNNDNNNNNGTTSHLDGLTEAPTDHSFITEDTTASNLNHLHLNHEATLPTNSSSPASVIKNDSSSTATSIVYGASLISNVNATSENDNNIITNSKNKISTGEKLVSNDESIREANLKIRRCKHGRIIVKDSSKKKPVQLGDKETNKLKVVDDTREFIRQSSSSSKNDEILQKQNCDEINEPLVETINPNNLIENDIAGRRTTSSKLENSPTSDRPREFKEKSLIKETSDSSKRNHSRSPTRRRSNTRNKSPVSRRRNSRSPPHRRSPRRDRDRHRSRSPRLRRTRSRSPKYRRSSPRRTSSKRGQARSPRKRDRELSNHRTYRQLSRNESPRRERSTSRSRTKSRSPARSHLDTCRSPFRNRLLPRRDRLSRFGQLTDRSEPPRKELFGNSLKSLGVIQNQEVLNKQNHSTSENSSNQLAPITSQDNSKSHTQHDNQIILNSPIDLNNPLETAQLEASPKKSLSAHSSSMTFSTDDSPTSDIYDPEGPVLPISPGDSPPLSPLNKAANHKIAYQMNVEKNDDDVPSSAVQLNQQEKYLQKLNRQERVVEEVKIALKPHYQRRAIDKEQYKDVLRRAVPKVSKRQNGVN